MGSEDDDEVFGRVDGAVGEADWDHQLVSLLLDGHEDGLHLFDEVAEVSLGYCEDEDLVLLVVLEDALGDVGD